MTVVRDLTGISPDLVLGALSVLPGAFWLCSGRATYAGALPDARSSALDPEPTLAPPVGAAAFAPSEGTQQFPRWVGALPYEAGRGLERTSARDPRPEAALKAPVWQRYGAVIRFDGGAEPMILADSAPSAQRLEQAVRSGLRPLEPDHARLSWAEPAEAESIHERRIVRAIELIERGELYQVNLARRFALRARGHPFDLALRMACRGGAGRLCDLAPFAAALDLGEVQVVSASPESFLELGPDGAIATRPIKGTRPRHPDPERDRALAEELDRSEKERAELAMVIDVERNDLGRIAVPGSVELAEAPSVVSLASVHHRQALVTARALPGTSRAEVLSVMLPSGSVTGAPKVRAMDLIRELESHRRGLYTGALGVLWTDGSVELSMAIRSLVLRGEQAEYFSGGGIVADSDPKAEVEETLWKARQLLALLGG